MPDKMRLFLHDYGGYPFTLELATALANRTAEVRYCYSAIDTSRAPLDRHSGKIEVAAIRGAKSLNKSSFVQRFQAEVNHGRLVGDDLARFGPHAVLSGNAPLESQWRIRKAAMKSGARFIYWMQDNLSAAASQILPKKVPLIGAQVAKHFGSIERALLQGSDHVVVISEGFKRVAIEWGVPAERVTVIENWAPALPVEAQEQAEGWKAEHGLTNKDLLLYSGTLGLKHKPELLLELASNLEQHSTAHVLAIAEGSGADWLKASPEAQRLKNLTVMPLQPYEKMPMALAAAAALVVLLERGASEFCVPSKALTYMRAGRPILAAVPESNPIAVKIREGGFGLVADPDDIGGFVSNGAALVADRATNVDMGARAKAYSDKAFDIERIASEFEQVLAGGHR